MIQQFRFWVVSQRKQNINSKMYLYLHIHCSIVYNQCMETNNCPLMGE